MKKIVYVLNIYCFQNCIVSEDISNRNMADLFEIYLTKQTTFLCEHHLIWRMSQETVEFKQNTWHLVMLQGKICLAKLLWGGCLSSVCEHTAAPSAAAAAIFIVWVLRGPDQPTRSWKLCRDAITTLGAGANTEHYVTVWMGVAIWWNETK